MWKKAHTQLRTISKRYAVRHMKQTCDTLHALPKKLQKKVDRMVERFIRLIPEHISTEKKVALLYYVLTSQISYDWADMDTKRIPYTFIGALCRQKAVCMGISELFCYLCTLLGVKAITVVGYACNSLQPSDSEDAGGLHAWVMVRLSDGQFYHLDPTWDLHKGRSQNWRPRWFLLSDEQMQQHYWIQEDYPKAKRPFTGKIEINQKGVDILCQHWKNLIAEFEQ